MQRPPVRQASDGVARPRQTPLSKRRPQSKLSPIPGPLPPQRGPEACHHSRGSLRTPARTRGVEVTKHCSATISWQPFLTYERMFVRPQQVFTLSGHPVTIHGHQACRQSALRSPLSTPSDPLSIKSASSPRSTRPTAQKYSEITGQTRPNKIQCLHDNDTRILPRSPR